MAEVAIKFSIAGAGPVQATIDQVRSKLEQTNRVSAAGLRDTRVATAAFSSSLGALNSVLRLTGHENSGFARALGQSSVAVFAVQGAVQAARGAMTAWPVVIAQVQRALALLASSTGIGLVILAVGVLAIGLKTLIDRKREASEMARKLEEAEAELAQMIADVEQETSSLILTYGMYNERIAEVIRQSFRYNEAQQNAVIATGKQLSMLEFIMGAWSRAARELVTGVVPALQAASGAILGITLSTKASAKEIFSFIDVQAEEEERIKKANQAKEKAADAARRAAKATEEFKNQIRDLVKEVTTAESGASRLGAQFQDFWQRQRLMRVLGPAQVQQVISVATSDAAAYVKAYNAAISTAPRKLPGAGQPFADVPHFVDEVTENARKAAQAMQNAAQSAREAWKTAIGEILVRARSMAEVMEGIWEFIKQTIIRKMAEALADKVWSFAKSLKLSTILPFPFNLLAGLFGLQSGGQFIATRPTPIIVGEGNRAERVRVTPLAGGMAGAGAGSGVTVVFQGPTFMDEIAEARLLRKLDRMRR